MLKHLKYIYNGLQTELIPAIIFIGKVVWGVALFAMVLCTTLAYMTYLSDNFTPMVSVFLTILPPFPMYFIYYCYRIGKNRVEIMEGEQS
jgi:hypothetical protein